MTNLRCWVLRVTHWSKLRKMLAEPQVRIFASPEHLFRAAAENFCRIGSQAIRNQGRFAVALSGGSTPRGLHEELARNFATQVPWQNVYFFWSDERHVPPTDAESNYRMANETLLSKLPIPAGNIFRIPAEMPDAGDAARVYEQTLENFFRPTAGSFPRFDLILLGMGPDGHTASLFPGTTALEEKQHWVVANWVEKFSTFRITFTYPVLNHAANVMILVSGADKAAMVGRALKDPTSNLPCQGVRPVDGELIWLVDQAAAAKL
jgi:6-phosphogluconolactonase